MAFMIFIMQVVWMQWHYIFNKILRVVSSLEKDVYKRQEQRITNMHKCQCMKFSCIISGCPAGGEEMAHFL